MQGNPVKMSAAQLCHGINISNGAPYGLQMTVESLRDPESSNSSSQASFQATVSSHVNSSEPSTHKLMFQELPDAIIALVKQHSSLKAPLLQNTAERQNPTALQQDLAASQSIAQPSKGPLANIQDGAAAISSAHVDAITLNFNTWSRLMQDARQASGSQMQTSPVASVTTLFSVPKPLLACHMPQAALKMGLEIAGDQLKEQMTSERPSEVSEPPSTQRDHQHMHLLFIAAGSCLLGVLAHGCCRYLAGSCNTAQADLQNKQTAFAMRSEPRPKEPSSLAHASPASHRSDCLTSGTGSGTGSQHTSRTAVTAQDSLGCTPGQAIMPSQHMLPDSVCSPGGRDCIAQCPSQSSMHSSDIQAQGSQQPRRSMLRRQSSVWARMNDGRLRKVVVSGVDEEDFSTA